MPASTAQHNGGSDMPHLIHTDQWRWLTRQMKAAIATPILEKRLKSRRRAIKSARSAATDARQKLGVALVKCLSGCMYVHAVQKYCRPVLQDCNIPKAGGVSRRACVSVFGDDGATSAPGHRTDLLPCRRVMPAARSQELKLSQLSSVDPSSIT